MECYTKKQRRCYLGSTLSGKNERVWLLKGYSGSMMDINVENEFSKPSSNSRLICCSHFCTDMIRKDMNLSIPTQLGVKYQSKRGSLALVGSHSKRRKIQQVASQPSFSRYYDDNSHIRKRNLRRVTIADALKGYRHPHPPKKNIIRKR